MEAARDDRGRLPEEETAAPSMQEKVRTSLEKGSRETVLDEAVQAVRKLRKVLPEATDEFEAAPEAGALVDLLVPIFVEHLDEEAPGSAHGPNVFPLPPNHADDPGARPALRNNMPDPADASSVIVSDRGALLDRIDAALAGASMQERRTLWVTVHSFPSLSLLEASFPAEVVADALREIEAHLLREYPELLAMTRLQNDEIACASLGPMKPRSLRGATARRRRFALERITVRGEPIFLSVRSGTSVYEDGVDATELLRRARVAHVTAGVRDQDDTQLYDDAMDRAVEAEARLLGRLVRAIDRNELDLIYQPQVELASGRLVGAEALVRWSGDDGNPVPPGRLIAAAERSGSVVPLGGWVLRAACRQADRWRAEGLPPFHVAVNVSPIQLHRTDLVRSVIEALEAHDLPPEWLELEITESGAMAGGDEAVRTANALRELGIALALDDFGTGTSSLHRLRELPLTRLKIDQSFVRHCPPPEEGRCLIRAIAAMGRSFGLRTLAEGVETAEQQAYVTAAGCDEAQGFHFAPGLPADELAAFARRRGVGSP